MTLFEEAICFAISAHSGATRKSSGAPYVLHLMDAAGIAGFLTADQEVLAAVVLHDTVEDTDVTISEIREKFGDRVADLVAAETENKRPELSAKESWKIRKQESLDELKACKDPAVKIMWLSDKLSNIRSLYRRWKKDGDAVWASFNQSDPAQQAWYYRSVLELLSDLKDTEGWQELKIRVDTIFEGY